MILVSIAWMGLKIISNRYPDDEDDDNDEFDEYDDE